MSIRRRSSNNDQSAHSTEGCLLAPASTYVQCETICLADDSRMPKWIRNALHGVRAIREWLLPFPFSSRSH